ncbi:unnamed protein product [Adineta ricciae]|uniref:Secreted protein n=1 Tax=Adineta ricciae TaxID=249248 RepID=A0A816CS91_ADIRI|nr:unnamed protein product [Adineta ricciae]
MNTIQVTLIVAVLIPAILCSRFSQELLLELLMEERAAVQETSSCNWITYDLDKSVASNNIAYKCDSITLVGGYCILRWSDAIKLCNSDPKCDGLSLTTNKNWHNAYDKNGEPAVHLFTAGSGQGQTNTEWYSLKKNCWKFNT